MLDRLGYFFTPPVFPDEEAKNRSAQLLNTVLLTGILIDSVASFALYTLLGSPLTSLAANFVLLALLVIAWLFLRSRRVALASSVLILAGWTYTTIALYLFGGLGSSVMSTMLVLIVVAGLLMGRWGAIGTMALVFLSAIGILYLQLSQQLPPPLVSPSPTENLIVFATQVVVLVAVVYLSNRNLADALRRTQHEVAERAQVEKSLRASEQRLSTIYDNTTVGITLSAPQGRFVFCNAALTRMLGYSVHELTAMSFQDITHPDDLPHELAWRAKIEQGEIDSYQLEKRYRTQSSMFLWVRVNIACQRDEQGTVQFVTGIIEDITDRKRTQESLAENKASYQGLFNSVAEAVYIQDGEGHFLDVNEGAVKMYRYPREFFIGKTPEIISAPGMNDLASVAEMLKRAFAGEPQQFEFWGKRSTGEIFPKEVRLYNGTWSGKDVVIAVAFDITERKKNQQALTRYAAEMTGLYESSLAINSQLDVAALLDSIVKRAVKLLGARMGGLYLMKPDGQTLELAVSHNLPGNFLKVQLGLGEGLSGRVAQTGKPMSVGDYSTWKGRAQIYEHSPFRRVLAVPLKIHDKVLGVINVNDDEKTGTFSKDEIRLVSLFADQAAIALENARLLEAAQEELAERTRAQADLRRLKEFNEGIVQNAAEGIVLENQHGFLTFANLAAAKLMGYTVDELVGKHWAETVTPKHHPIVQAADERRIQGISDRYEIELLHKNTRAIPVLVASSPRFDPTSGEFIGTLAVFTDITEQKRAEDEIRLHLQRLDALRSIDAAISNSLDVRVTLNVLLDQVVSKMHVDAADILLFNSMSQTLEYAVGRGYGPSIWRERHVRLGEFPAGVAALDRHPISILDLAEPTRAFPRAQALLDEGFRFYHVVPFIAKGQVKGVLEVCRRNASTPPDAEWTTFMEMLCGSAAIAIDNMSLFERVQRTNTELSLAYDITLEGWSNALELRTHETEGHARHLTEITLQLASACGIGEEELAHVRRGALLHDIGTMGIPDHILLKPGPLTDEEWVLMKQHTMYAHKLLSHIFFLRPALDIAYCHHERWDGSGYPRGLKGEQIPLAARVFAVVDSWDALRSDRPYRKAWSESQVRAYLRDQAGTCFDPHIVETFLAMDM